MNELELLWAFFHRWEEYHLLPKGKGAPSKEHKAAAAKLLEAAQAIKGYVPPTQTQQPSRLGNPSEFRSLQQSISMIEPKDGRVPHG
jgi:hypothetical protein